MAMPQLNWDLDTWTDAVIPGHPPSATVADLVTQSAEQMQVLQFSPLAPNSTYAMDVREPYLQCASPNSTQIPIFNYYQRSLITSNGTPIAMVTEKSLPRALHTFQTTPKLHATDGVDP
jgi:hypothetical protein